MAQPSHSDRWETTIYSGRIALADACVGDIFMSLIHTCRLCGVDPFDYLTALQRQPGELTSNTAKWMPWNYGPMLVGAPTPVAPIR